MLIAGLTGGMAVGKTFVAQALENLGCNILEADEIGREVMEPGHSVYSKVMEAFGPSVVLPNGTLDRTALALAAFSSPANLARLNSIVHPAVRTEAMRRIREIGEHDPDAIVIYVAAILIESGAFREVDKMIVVICPPERQFERAMLRPNAGEAAVRARIASQMPVDKKVAFADYVIDSGGTKEETLRQTADVYEHLRRLAS